ncbi:DNA methyltransferase [Enterococcus faecium]|nr:DNA methyltransferase [Enterococcus faecium]EME7096548.1 DNA methyltransferase [Enterococcus faecium]NTR92143.1 DNA methyltransferase [Enterococcus faecium]
MKKTIDKSIGEYEIYIEISSILQREPGWPIQLLIQKNVKMTAINNLDKSMRSLWYSILNYPNKFINLINKTIVNIEEWPRQKEICKKEFNHPFSLEEGFATFFLNITNVGGITSGGQIEGTKQESKYKVGCCFNKQSLIKK